MHVNATWGMSATGRGAVLAAVAGTGLLLAAGCGGGGQAAGENAHKAVVTAARVVITPADGTVSVRPDRPVTVRAVNGTLGGVVLRAGGERVPGDFNAERTEWRSRWALTPGARISVRATARNAAGQAVSTHSDFQVEAAPKTYTVTPSYILDENRGRPYGVGLPIVLDFDKPVTDRAAVERAMEVSAEKPVLGAWHWFGDQEVVYRAKSYWPAHQTVTLTAHLAGVPISKGVYGTKDIVRTYHIGAAQIAYLNIKTDKMRVEWDGVLKRRIPISAGMGGSREYTTTSGKHLDMEKGADVWMTSPGRQPGDPGYYHELIHYAVRVSNAGEYLHQTPGAEDCLGNRNCSHGCIRQPADDAKWYFRHAQPGDPVEITGTDREVEPDNGWSFYQMPWDEWLKGSTLRQ